jgi:hypothetical protein
VIYQLQDVDVPVLLPTVTMAAALLSGLFSCCSFAADAETITADAEPAYSTTTQVMDADAKSLSFSYSFPAAAATASSDAITSSNPF